MKQPSCTLYTIGHSTRSIEQFLDLLKAHSIEELVDVRRGGAVALPSLVDCRCINHAGLAGPAHPEQKNGKSPRANAVSKSAGWEANLSRLLISRKVLLFMDGNWLYYGDNLDVLRRYVKDETVDLVYLDPPFNSNQDYHVLFAEQDGSRSATQIQVFKDSWHWDQEAADAYKEIVEAGGRVSQAMQAFRQMLGANDMLAYLAMMTSRLVELQRVLKPTGSIYLHCDPTASHYLKILMDAIFGVRNFRNEIIWFYKTGGASKRHFSRKHDVILFYSKTDDYVYNAQKEKSYMMHEYGFKKSDFQKDERGQYTWVYMKDVWEIPSIGSADSQRLGYPTQKPLALLERIIGASSNPGDVVLDPFCGCGTTIDAAQRLERRWIGIDSNAIGIALTRARIGIPDHLICSSTS